MQVPIHITPQQLYPHQVVSNRYNKLKRRRHKQLSKQQRRRQLLNNNNIMNISKDNDKWKRNVCNKKLKDYKNLVKSSRTCKTSIQLFLGIQ